MVFQQSEPTSTIKFTNAVILSSSFNFNRSSCNLKAMLWLVELIPSNSAVFLLQTMCQPREKTLVILNTIEVELRHICFLYLASCIFETVFQQTDLPSTIKFTNAVIISIIVVFLVFQLYHRRVLNLFTVDFMQSRHLFYKHIFGKGKNLKLGSLLHSLP